MVAELTAAVSEVVATETVGFGEVVVGLTTSSSVVVTVSPGLTTEPLKMLQVSDRWVDAGGGVAAEVADLRWSPSLMSIVKIFVTSVLFGKVIVNWLPAAPDMPPVEEVLNPIV